MKQFQVFRYLKRWRYLILAVMLVGGYLFYSYTSENQTYTASVTIRYTNSGAADGLRPDGEPIDVTEIFSSKVIAGALDALGASVNIERIRSNCAVNEIIPEDELIRKAAILDKGDEYVYHATDYLVSYTADASSSADRARRVLSAILDAYFKGYAERYISETVLPDNAANLIGSSYDYAEQVELLEQSLSDILFILDGKRDLYASFRSAQTGYSFNDLYLIYEYIYENTVPYLYAQVLDNAISKDDDVLVRKYKDKIESCQRGIETNEEKLAYLDKIIAEYGDKLSEMLKRNSGDTAAADVGNVLQNVYDPNEGQRTDHAITYDALLRQRIAYQLSARYALIDQEHAEDMVRVFSGSTKQESEAVDATLASAVAVLKELHTLLSATCSEFNEYLAEENLRVLSNVNVREGLNVKLYLILALCVFFICGCVGSVLLGRGEDIMEYILYNDSKTGLPNRARCDQEIAAYENSVLPDNFCCAIVSLDNLRMTNDKEGYAAGNQMLRQTALILSEVTHGLGFTGYNNAGHYMCLFEDCSQERADAMSERLLKLVEQYNAKHTDEPLSISSAIACSSECKVYDIKQLLRTVYQKLGRQGDKGDKGDKGGAQGKA